MKDVFVKLGWVVVITLASVGGWIIGKKIVQKVQTIRAKVKRAKETADLGVC